MNSLMISIAECLTSHPWVSECYEGNAGTPAASERGVVLVLNTDGVTAVRTIGRQAVIERLQNQLSHHTDEQPSVWRLCDARPPQTVDSLLHMPRPIDAIVVGEQQVAGTWVIDLQVPLDLQHFSGHFPTAPVLPGVVQVAWALALAAPRLRTPSQCHSIEALKFQQFLRPGDRVALTLRSNETNGKLYFSYRRGELSFSSGRLLCGAPA